MTDTDKVTAPQPSPARPIYTLDVERLREKAKQSDAPEILLKALAEYDALMAKGERAVIYIEDNLLVVGTIHVAPNFITPNVDPPPTTTKGSTQ